MWLRGKRPQALAVITETPQDLKLVAAPGPATTAMLTRVCHVGKLAPCTLSRFRASPCLTSLKIVTITSMPGLSNLAAQYRKAMGIASGHSDAWNLEMDEGIVGGAKSS